MKFILKSFIPLSILAFFAVVAPSAEAYQFIEWVGINQASAGQIQTAPVGHALTAIGYGSDDHACDMYLKTAPVNADGTVNFAQADTSWSHHVGCDSAGGGGGGLRQRSEPAKKVLQKKPEKLAAALTLGANGTPTAELTAPTNHVVTGWSWGANTSGGDRTSDEKPPDECYYQEYMNLKTKQIFGWGFSATGTCLERGYFYTDTYNNFKGIARAPAGRVIVGIRFGLADDANITWMGITVEDPQPPKTAGLGTSTDKIELDPNNKSEEGDIINTQASNGSSFLVTCIMGSGIEGARADCPSGKVQTNAPFSVTVNSPTTPGTYTATVTINAAPDSATNTATVNPSSKTVTVTYTVPSGPPTTTVTPTPTPTPTPVSLGSPDIKAKVSGTDPLTDGPVTIPYDRSATVTWGPAGGGTANYSNCWASDNWSGQKDTSGSFITPTNQYFTDTTRVYTINCTNNTGLTSSDSVSVIFKGRSQQAGQTCSLSVDKDSVMAGETATWMAVSDPSSKPYYWYGTNNSVPIAPVYGGITNNAQIYTYYTTPYNHYTRYFKIQSSPDAPAECTSNTVSLTVNSVSDSPGPTPAGALTCSVSPQNDTTDPRQFTLTLGNTRNGYNYNWSGYGSACTATLSQDSGGGSGKSATLNCGTGEGEYTATGTEAATGRNATCSFSACPDGGCEPPPPDPGPLTAAVDGRYEPLDCGAEEPCQQLLGNWQDPLSIETSPNSVVDFKYNLNGSFIYRGDRIDLDCTGDGSVEKIIRRDNSNWNATQIAFLDACAYPDAGTYTATGKIYNGSTLTATDTATIVVTRKPDFTFTGTSFAQGSYWTIPNNGSSPQFDSKYDYNNDAVMNKADLALLQQYALSRRCPAGKECDLNKDGELWISDAAAYSRMLRNLTLNKGFAATATVYLSSQGGASVTIGNIPATFTVAPNPVNIPANGNVTAELRAPPTLNIGTYTITLNGTAGTVTANDATLTLNVQNAPPARDFRFETSWELPKGTRRYDEKGNKYDYNNDDKMSVEDVLLLMQYLNSRSCPSNKECDFNGESGFDIGDPLAYTIYLKRLDIPRGYSGARATVRLTSTSGATVAIGNVPTRYSLDSATVTVPAGGVGTTYLRVPNNVAAGEYTVTLSGTDGGVTNSDLSPLTLNVGTNSAPFPPTGPGGTGGPQVLEPNYCNLGPGGTVNWAFSDPDGDSQSAFQVLVDDQGSFQNPEVDSGKMLSSGTSYAIPQGRLAFNTTYKARVYVWDTSDARSNNGDSPSWQTPKHAYPDVDFTWTPTTPAPNKDVQFTDQTAFADGGGQRSWNWLFGDGAGSSSQNPIHRYVNESPPPYTVSLTVTDKDGYQCSLSKPLSVQKPIPIWKEVTPR